MMAPIGASAAITLRAKISTEVQLDRAGATPPFLEEAMKLRDWLEEHDARKLWQVPVKGADG